MRMAFLFCFLLSASCFADDIQPMSLEAATAHADLLLPRLLEKANKRHLSLSRQQLLFARDMLIGYHHRKRGEQGANIVWLRVPEKAKSDFQRVIDLVGDFLDPEHGIERIGFDLYLNLEPELLQQKLREERKHLVVLDDFTKLIGVSSQDTTRSIPHLDSSALYIKWVLYEAPTRLTLFVLDEDGELLQDEVTFDGHARIDFVGSNYELEDEVGSEVLRLKECNKRLRRTIN